MKKNFRKETSLTILLAIFLAGCGSASQPATGVIGNTTPNPNQTGGNNGAPAPVCTTSGSIKECDTYLVNTTAPAVIDIQPMHGSYNFPYLTPSSPNGVGMGYPFDTGVAVSAGDKVVVNTYGKWGDDNFGTFFHTYQFRDGFSVDDECYDTALNADANGIDHSPSPNGLVASDGANIWSIGNGTSSVVADGTLYFGFNANIQTNFNHGLCAHFTVSLFKIRHCTNVSSGATVVCP